MNPSSGNPGINKLANTLCQRIGNSNTQSLVLDFGTIQNDFSLLTNTFPKPIPKTDYLVCRSVSYDPEPAFTKTWWKGESPADHVGHGHGNKGEHPQECSKHYHDVYLAEDMRPIRPGDRVLVAWVQNDAVVIDIVLPADMVKES